MSDQKGAQKKPWAIEGNAPDEPHLLAYDGNSGLATAYPRGSLMGVCVDPHRFHPMQRMLVEEVTPLRWKFRCTCSPMCTVRWIARVTEEGFHSQ